MGQLDFNDNPEDGYTRTYMRWDGGWMEFDAVLREDITLSSALSTHPIDPGFGGTVPDHVINTPISLALEVVITDFRPSAPRTHGDGATNELHIVEFETFQPLVPGEFGPNAIGGIPLGYSNRAQLRTDGTSTRLNRIKSCFEEFNAIRTEKRTLSVVTNRLGAFDNLVLTNIHPIITKAGMTLQLAFEQAVFVELKEGTLKLVKPQMERSKDPQNGGRGATKKPDADKENKGSSTLKKGYDYSKKVLNNLLGG